MQVLKNFILSFCFIITGFLVFGQETSKIFGTLINDKGLPVEAASIAILDTTIGTISDEKGNFNLKVPANKNITIVITHISHNPYKKELRLKPNEVFELKPIITTSIQVFNEVSVEAEQARHTPMRKIETKYIKALPSASGNFEAILASQPGVVTNNELTSQYSVRGGNFDENLVYVNDIEIYRPFLIRSGQQEGLSFINSNLVQDVQFSAGGFEAKYGDKMSSVLDITYKKPTKFAGSASASLLGASAHIEAASKNYRFTQIHGFRYKTNRYLLGSLDTKGQYRPAFTDYQTYLTYDITEKLEISFLGNVSSNKYQMIPQSQQTKFGDINQGLQLTVYFDGQEVDQFTTYFGAFATNYRPNKNLNLKFIASGFRTKESETFDILGQYWLDELERDLSSDDFGDIAFNRGVGTFLNHGRNYLDALIYNAAHKGILYKGKTTFLWGAKVQQEIIHDEYKEWTMIDSSGFSIPQYPYEAIELYSSVGSKNNMFSSRVTDYFQINKLWQLKDTSQMIATIGGRTNYWTYNNQFIFSPRATFSYEPNWKKDFLFRASVGYYYQPPFYRELRNFQGELNTDIKAQQSIHFVLGSDYNFKMWGRQFKMVNEIYYKKMNNLIPYELNNVRLRYYATNNAIGRAYGIDSKINGEFVKGVESWFSLSVMKIEENLTDDYYIDYFDSTGIKVNPRYSTYTDSTIQHPGYIPRPTDQRVTFGLFFQDYIPNRPQYKVHLNLLYGTGLPTGPPSYERYKDTLRMPSYRRVDIGFSYSLINKDKDRLEKSLANKIQDAWISVEVFNLLQISNTISYLWIRDVNSTLYAVPNYLTSRRINVKFVVEF